MKDYKKAIELYDQEQYQAAHDILEDLVGKSLTAFRIRAHAKRSLGRCKAEIATIIVYRERTLEGYAMALELLAEANKLAGPSEEIERRIREYRQYKAGLESAPKAPAPAEEEAKGE